MDNLELTKQEMMDIKGGIGAWGVAGIVGAVIFIIGVIDGYVRPLACQK